MITNLRIDLFEALIHTGMNIFIIIILAAVLWWRLVQELQETGTEKV